MESGGGEGKETTVDRTTRQYILYFHDLAKKKIKEMLSRYPGWRK